MVLAAWPAVTRVGINHVVHERRIPLVLKVGQFLLRDARYARQTRRIVSGIHGEEARAMAIYRWTRTHVSAQPKDADVIDDHVWNIIARGYGASDQQADVFTTLLTYAGVPAYWSLVGPGSGSGRVPISYVLIGGRWRVFDVAHDIAFRAPAGHLATVEELAATPELIRDATAALEDADAYVARFDGFTPPAPRPTLRPRLHTPIGRLMFEMRRSVQRPERGSAD
jgi:hypothetical protein